MTIPVQNNLIIKQSPLHGYGVFAGKDFEKDEVIEKCYTLLADGKDKILRDYYFGYKEKTLVTTGFGFIYNHHEQPNAKYCYDELNKLMVFIAKRPIQKGEEILITYGMKWFSTRNKTPIKKMSWWRKILRYSNEPLVRSGILIGGFILLFNLLRVLTER